LTHFGSYVFRNIDPETGWASREEALKASEMLKEHISSQLPKPIEADEKVG
jgi:hypothetical protein